MANNNSFYFAPQLIISDGIAAIDFYKKAFEAKELGRWSNDDGSVHVAELSIGEAVFHIREESIGKSDLSPTSAGGNTVIVGLFVSDVDEVVKKAESAGATVTNKPQDFDYGYRQATLIDPFGHRWLIEKKID